MITIYPMTFTPAFKDYLWGGRNLETKLGRTIPAGIIAESWEISGHPAGPTTVDNGPLAGYSLPDVLGQLGLDLVGTRSQAMLERGKFPLLIKILDANRALSVQVHPKDDYANEHEGGELGKTEMWYVLDSKPNAQLIYGVKHGVTPDSFRNAIAAGNLETQLHYVDVQKDDAIFIPAGSVHAILDGLLIAEIQQNSDTTYRVYDWNRVDSEGKSRPLHVDKALDVINFNMVEPGPYEPKLVEDVDGVRREIISQSNYFVVEKLTVSNAGKAFRGNNDGTSFEIWGAMAGNAQIVWSNDPLPLPAVKFCLLPAALGAFAVTVDGPATLLRVYVPEN